MTRGVIGDRLAERVLLGATVLGLLVACSEPEPRTPRRREAPEAPRFVEVVGGVGWEARPPLIARAPRSEMRHAEYAVEGHPEAVLVVSYFPPAQGGGGDVRANVSRWVGQVRRPPGETPRVRERRVHDLDVTTVDVRGAFVGRRGEERTVPRDGWRLLGAIVRAERGLVFFKLTGTDAGVGEAEDAFEELVSSLHPE